MNLRIGTACLNARSKSETFLTNRHTSHTTRRTNYQKNTERELYLLNSIRSRKPRNQQIPASVGTEVIRNSILPMLNTYERSFYLIRRKSEPQKLTLSVQLLSRLESAKQDLKERRAKLKDSHKTLESLNRKLQRMKLQVLNSKRNSQILKTERIKVKPKITRFGNYRDMKQMCDSSYKNWMKYCYEAFEARKISAQTDLILASQTHSSSHLMMTNAILGERLKNLYIQINDYNHVPLLLTNIIKKFSTLMKDKENFFENKMSTLVRLLGENIENFKFNLQKSEGQPEILKKINTLKVYTIDTVTLLNKKIWYTTQGTIRSREKYKKLEKRFEKLKVLNYKVTKSLEQSGKEKMCDNCKTFYIDDNNNSNACCFHLSYWNGEIYWCCGSTDVNSEGCFTGSHSSQNIQDDPLDVCSSCRGIGHSHKHCPRDPNVRKADFMEIIRLKKLANRKVQQKFYYSDLNNDNWDDIDRLKSSKHNKTLTPDLFKPYFE